MRKLWTLITSLIPLILLSFSMKAGTPKVVKWASLPDLVVGANLSQGVSAPYAGVIDGNLVVAGGCNFPNIPAVDGGKKVYYNDVFMLNLSDASSGWKRIGSMPFPAAYGVSIAVKRGLVCIGGMNDYGSLSSVWMLVWSKAKRTMVVNYLPSLPYAMDNMAGAADGEYIYVAGGNSNGIPSTHLLRLNIKKPNQEWEELPSFPGLPRVQPVAFFTPKAEGRELQLWGGFSPASDTLAAVAHSNGLKFSISTKEWSPVQDITINGSLATLTGAAVAANSGDIVAVGGVNKSIFENALNRDFRLRSAIAKEDKSKVQSLKDSARAYLSQDVGFYHFNSSIMQYADNGWVSLGSFEQAALAGCAIVPYKNRYYIIGGEVKPGVRSKRVWFFEL